MFEIFQFPYNDDNYGVLLHSPETNLTAAIDAGDADAYIACAEANGLKIDQIWLTHHHGDHTAGTAAMKARYGCLVLGAAATQAKVGQIDTVLADGDSFEFAGAIVHVIHTPGHTLDMLNFYLADPQLVFTGDTLFALGCGRLFEGNASQMWQSLQKLMVLPPNTTVYCSHEYTLANAKFALSVEPANTMLQSRVIDIEALRAEGQPTVPTNLQIELDTNPFLRPHSPEIRERLEMTDATDAEVFAKIRALKDSF
ncbi:MAG: hydroxyacylglutathione hydrolase [Gammaproteobacteria bacterium]|nr:hydroxyacylglutathione hydrolase [Gammaproteobacteria bacterium]